ncbi:acyl-CoA dehydrogenase family protein [Gordonia liuliyuniae]|uniref:Acyl-CoA dehydrogenase family protein n=1 Tax=Gordonia liuliyuniae TaxID=2911517 RepID=A0ABS9IP64_9ACTN|nr:acyl-CoA dehydrogenase family protein [Gordonia liuliyuniae]MCF8587320.1 acyl-CoA dehydrogenase family protein [Gordonia liuliyuniae]
MDRGLYTSDHDHFREVVREFVRREVEPNYAQWEEDHSTGRDVWASAGEHGIVGLSGPEEYGGPGIDDFRYRMVVCEELARVGATSLSSSFSLQDDILIPYVTAMATDDQKARWLPDMCAGRKIMAVGMTEPGTGSDLKGIKTSGTKVDGGWRVSGSKTFITSGIQSDYVVVVTKTDPAGGTDAFTLLVVEAGMAGFTRGRKLAKLGLQAQDTAELFFEDVFVPDDNVLGIVGGGFRQLMGHLPLERLSIAAMALATADAALQWTLDYTSEREAFGRPVADFQNSRFVLADMATELDVTRAFVDKCVLAQNDGALTAVDAAKAKLWASEVQNRVIDRCLQLHGGYGWMMEYPIARAYLDARVQKIYGGTNQIMRQIIGRDLTGRR